MMFEGIIAAVFTEFSPDGSKPILDNIPKYSRFLSSNGVKSVLVNGTSGEGMSMTVDERKAVAETWIKAGQADKMHVQIQVGGTNIRDVLNLARHAESLHADSLLTLPELYNMPQSVGELVEYLKTIADAAPSTPLLYYHNPGYSSVDLNMVEMIQEAGKTIPTFAGIKYTNTDLMTGSACANLDPKKYKVFLGCDQVMSGAYLLGFRGSTATSANVFPSICLNILEAVKAGQLNEAQEWQKKLTEAIDVINKYGLWVPSMKAAFAMKTGIIGGNARFPLKSLSDGSMIKLKEDLIKIGAL